MLRSCALEISSQGTSCGTATFSRFLSSVTVCALLRHQRVLLRASGRCVQRVCEWSRFTAGQISRYSHVASAPPPPVVRRFREEERERSSALSLSRSLSEKTQIWSPPQSQDETYCNDKPVSRTSPRTVFKETKSSHENLDEQIPERVAHSHPCTPLEAYCWSPCRHWPLTTEAQHRVRNIHLGRHWLLHFRANYCFPQETEHNC